MVELLWGTAPKPSRGPKPALTVAGIAEAAIGIADAEGLDAVSMQRVATELPVTKMALYRYVPGKAELVAVMTDLAVGVPGDYAGLSWRDGLRRWALDLYQVFERHPWLLLSTVGRRILGPNELTWTERGVQTLAGTGLGGGEQLDAVLVVIGHVRNLAQQALSIPGGTGGVNEEQVTETIGRILRDQPERFPALAAAIGSADRRDQGLTFGLDRILDGLDRLIEERSGRVQVSGG